MDLDDTAFLHEFLAKLTDEEADTLRYNLDRGVCLSTPEQAIPQDGYG